MALSVLFLLAFCGSNEPRLEGKSIAEWKSRILPSKSERSADGIGWIPSFSDGLRAAATEKRPLLLWLMNGHPLGCT